MGSLNDPSNGFFDAVMQKTFSDYMAEYKRLQRVRPDSRPEKTLRIALLSSSTTAGIKEVLDVKCHDLGLTAELYDPPYGQFAQEILDPKSPLYAFGPSLTILNVDIMHWLGEDFFFPYRHSPDERMALAIRKCEELSALVTVLSSHVQGKIILHNFMIPYCTPMGILENKQQFGLLEMIRSMNGRLADEFKNSPQVFVFDYEGFCSKYGKVRIVDNNMYYLGDFQLGFDHIPLLCEDYMAFIKPLAALSKKCLVLDLDNTLWGGVIGEDSVEGIMLGPTPEGRPFLEFQKYILCLAERGVLLAINSSNNPDDVDKVFREHPHMVLKKDHFAAVEINWNDKISNMRAIAKKINIGLDAFVFLDDLQYNRQMVRAALPEVLVPELPEDPSDYLKALMELNDFNAFQLTAEDKNRHHLYALDRQRVEHRKKITDITEYLRDMKIVVTIARADPTTIPRIAQLTQKTNQFNMTTQRYQEEDVRRLVDDPAYISWSVNVADRFGDNGVSGVVIVRKEKERWFIDTFLLSCRIIGRKVEETLLSRLIDEAKKAHVAFLVGKFIPTAKNAPAKGFYENSGFSFKGQNDRLETWEFDVSHDHNGPNFIEVIWKD